MRHGMSGRKFNRTSSHRKAMFSNMAAALIKHLAQILGATVLLDRDDDQIFSVEIPRVADQVGLVELAD